METNNEKYPTADFFNFEVYQLSELKELNLVDDPNKTIVVLLQNASEDDLALLGKIFQAIGKNLATDAYVLNEASLSTYKMISKTLSFEKALFFGINPKAIGLHLQVGAYRLIPFQEKQLLFSHNLKTIANDLEKKKLLWGQLQVMFK